jgi:F-type H+-transporting ATPase subunit gamma
VLNFDLNIHNLKYIPLVIGFIKPTLLALIHAYLFVSKFKASAESLASENASRLASMQRAKKKHS